MPICVFCTYAEKSSKGTSMLGALNDKQRQKCPHPLPKKTKSPKTLLWKPLRNRKNWKRLKNTTFLELGKGRGSWLLSTTPPRFQPSRKESIALNYVTTLPIKYMEGRYLWIRFRVVSILSWTVPGQSLQCVRRLLTFWSKTCNTPNSTNSSLSSKIWQQKEKLVKGMC